MFVKRNEREEEKKNQNTNTICFCVEPIYYTDVKSVYVHLIEFFLTVFDLQNTIL